MKGGSTGTLLRRSGTITQVYAEAGRLRRLQDTDASRKKRCQQMGCPLEKHLNHKYRPPFYPSLSIKPEKTAWKTDKKEGMNHPLFAQNRLGHSLSGQSPV